MTQYLILCRSLSTAQRASRALERAGTTAVVVKAPAGLSKNGCGYGVSLRRDLTAALSVLDRARIPYGKVFSRPEGGEYREVER